MTDFDAQFNQILSDPEAMAQIANLAQSLSGVPPQSGSEELSGNSARPVPANSSDAQTVSESERSSATPAQTASNPERSSATPTQTAPANASARLPDLDAFQKFLPLLQNLGGQRDSDARRLLYALRPYLPPRRQENIERALRLARLWRLGKNFLTLTEREG